MPETENSTTPLQTETNQSRGPRQCQRRHQRGVRFSDIPIPTDSEKTEGMIESSQLVEQKANEETEQQNTIVEDKQSRPEMKDSGLTPATEPQVQSVPIIDSSPLSSSQETEEQRFRLQLETLHSMGFTDTEANLVALRKHSGQVDDTLEELLNAH